ncbi:MAG: autotransporter-associated beta strand repeat-containing protein [Terrimicrobiaceae bacterium]|nr:autotransporter-associated beta strand repeat-containing protein [Terrimicrobiaceae bacterium]
MKPLILRFCLVCAVAFPSHVFAQTWNAAGNGTWSTAGNWTPATVPGTGNTAILNNTSSNRTVTYDTAASGTVGTLTINQTTAGVTNAVDLLRSLTLQSALTLGASGGTALMSIGSNQTVGFSLTSANGVVVNSGGVLGLSATTNTGGTGFQTASTSASTAITISGGTLQIQASTGSNTTAAANNTINGNLTMTSGSIHFDNIVGSTADRRVDIRGSLVNITGGTITANRSGSILQFQSTANSTMVLNPDSFQQSNISLNFQSDFTQNFSTNQTLGSIALRGIGVKTITSTAVGNGVGQLQFWDTNNAIASSAATLRLGSNLTLNSGANQPLFINNGNSVESGRVDAAIDTNGFTLDLTPGATSGVWTAPASTQAGVTNTVWTLSGSGVIRANGFNFSTANVTTNVGADLVLEAAGGNSVANNLGGNGTISASAIFRYTGNAAVGTPSTLTFGRDVPNIEVTGPGTLRILSGATGNITSLSVSNGTLDLNGASRSFGTLSLTGGTLANGTYTMTSGNFTGLQTGTVSGQLSGASSLVKDSPGSLILSGNNNFGSGGSVTVNQGTLVAGSTNAFGATSVVTANGGNIDLGGLSINKWFNIGPNGGTISNGTIARNTSSNATFAWQAGTVSANVTQAGGGIVSITKSGNGTLTLSGTLSNTGNITVTAGTLLIDGTTGSSLVNVQSGGTLGGNGTIGGVTTISANGTLSPGNSPGTLTFDSSLTLLASSTSLFEIDGFAPGEFDLALGVGNGQTVTFDGTLSLVFQSGFNTNGTIKIFDFDNFTGTFDSVLSSGLASGYSASFNHLTGELTVVPEPATWTLLGLGAAAALLRRRRNRANLG